MDLTSTDIRILESAGHSDFFISDEYGKRLRNIEGSCIFLGPDGLCRVYTIRPKGCRLYPLAMKLPSRTPTFDDDCPHAKDFRVDPDEVLELEALVDELLEEQ